MTNPSENISEEYLKQKERINKSLRLIKKKPPKNLDAIFQDYHDEAFKNINCLDCGNCCKTSSPMLFEKDIERLASHLKMKPGVFYQKYLTIDEDDFNVFKETPCPFLGSDNACAVYEYRPKACREYPHTNQRKMHTLLGLAEINAGICPAVLSIVKKLAQIPL